MKLKHLGLVAAALAACAPHSAIAESAQETQSPMVAPVKRVPPKMPKPTATASTTDASSKKRAGATR